MAIVDHPRYTQISNYTASVVAAIVTAQNDFFAANDRYFQGLWLLGNKQVDGTTDETIVEISSPSDFPVTWADFAPGVFKKNVKIPANIRIDVYESKNGWGWILRAEVVYAGLGPDAYGNDGDRWIYQHHEGPDTPQSGVWDEWHIVPETPE